MDLNQVAIFVRVVDAHGFSAAAKALAMPKSSVSRAVSLLERELGIRLLHRSTRSLSLTDAGRVFYDSASRGLAEMQQAATEVDVQGKAMRGTIRITAPLDAGVWLLAPAIAAFTERHPHVYVEVVLTGRSVDLIAEGFDLAVRAGPIKDTSLIARKLGSVDSGLYAGRGYVERHGVPCSAAELAHHPAVLYRPSRGRSLLNLVGPNGEEHVELQGPIAVDDFSFVRRAIVEGAGIGRLPFFLAAGDTKQGILVRVLPAHRIPGRPLHLVYASARHTPRRVVALREFLVERINRSTAQWTPG